jgi:hypothetical protein
LPTYYKKIEYPQNELFYLFTISWNQGVMRFKRGGDNPYCKLAMELSNFVQGKDEIIKQVYQIFFLIFKTEF